MIPLYNTKPIRELSYEHQYFLSEGNFCKKGAKYNVPFPVKIVPENLVIENNKFTYHSAAKHNAKQWMLANNQQIFIEWWGPDHSNVEAITSIIVRFRDFQKVSWNEEVNQLKHIQRIGSPAQKRFASRKLSEINALFNNNEYQAQGHWQKFLKTTGNLLFPKGRRFYYQKHQPLEVDDMLELLSPS